MKRLVKSCLATAVRRLAPRVGYEVRPAWYDRPPGDVAPEHLKIIHAIRPYTMTSFERMVALMNAVEHVVVRSIPGALVECGVWRGGSSMGIAKTLLHRDTTDRDLYLFDTFEGMTEPTEHDGQRARDGWEDGRRADHNEWCYVPFDDVRKNLDTTGYPPERIHLVKGKVEDTLPAQAPDAIALLRLDTDWYESTKHEMVHLFPRLVPGGIVIIDDYGSWPGCRQAVDEYMREHEVNMHLVRIDFAGRLGVKR